MHYFLVCALYCKNPNHFLLNFMKMQDSTLGWAHFVYMLHMQSKTACEGVQSNVHKYSNGIPFSYIIIFPLSGLSPLESYSVIWGQGV